MKRKKQYLDKIYDFAQVADQDLVIEVNERQMIPKKMRFMQFLAIYQTLHYEKYGEYLKF